MSEETPNLKNLLEEMRANMAQSPEGEAEAAGAEEAQARIAETNAMIQKALTEVGPDATIYEVPEGILPVAEEVPKVRRVPRIGGAREAAPPPDPWSRTVPELGTVNVTSAEWEGYYRRFLLGERHKLVTRIEVLPGQVFECVIQDLTPGEKELLALAVMEIMKTNPIVTGGGELGEGSRKIIHADNCLKLECVTSILKVTGRPEWQPFLLEMGDDMLPEEYPRLAELIKTGRTRFNNSHLFTLLVRSLHLAAVKFTILEDALANRDFTSPAGVA